MMKHLKIVLVMGFMVFAGLQSVFSFDDKDMGRGGLAPSEDELKRAYESLPSWKDIGSAYENWIAPYAPNALSKYVRKWTGSDIDVIGSPIFAGNSSYTVRNTGVPFKIEIKTIYSPDSLPQNILNKWRQHGKLVGIDGANGELSVDIIAGGDNSGFPVVNVPLKGGKAKYTASDYYSVNGTTYQVIIGVDPFTVDGVGAYKITLEEVLIHH